MVSKLFENIRCYAKLIFFLFQNRNRKRSKVWDKFRDDGKLAVCKICNQVIRHSGSTSNLINHLRVHEMKQEILKPKKEPIQTTEDLNEMVVYEDVEQTTDNIEGEFISFGAFSFH